MAIIAGWGRGGWGELAFGEPLPVNVTGNQATVSIGTVTVVAITNVDVNVTGVVASVATSSVTVDAKANASVTGNSVSCNLSNVNVYGLIITGQTTDWKEVA
mgnify:CR=1 FL=1|tara:strand:+ start:1919 stop:2224 length:306 start_codon:yes stop_codon:yes gene_type:complete